MAIVNIGGQSAKAQVLIEGIPYNLSPSENDPNYKIVPQGEYWKICSGFAIVNTSEKAGDRQYLLRVTTADGNTVYESSSTPKLGASQKDAKRSVVLGTHYIAASGSIVSIVDQAGIDPEKDEVKASFTIIAVPIPA